MYILVEMVKTKLRFWLFIFFICTLACSNQLSGQKTNTSIQFDWETLASLPPSKNDGNQPGLAGAFAGIHENVLIVAGGANFPDGPVWKGGTKAYHREVYVLEKTGNSSFDWRYVPGFRLSQNTAYGLSIPTDQGLICLGGMNDSTKLADVFVLSWNSSEQKLERFDYPSLPHPASDMSGGQIGSQLYVAASLEDGTKFFWSLDLTDLTEGWKSLPTWKGSARTHAMGIVQNNGETDCFYLFKGRHKGQRAPSQLLTDIWEFNPVTNQWSAIQSTGAMAAKTWSAGTAIASGANHIIFFGGDDGLIFNELELLALEIDTTTNQRIRQHLTRYRDSIMINHPGFAKEIWSFHTITQTWSRLGDLPFKTQVTTTAVIWDNQVVIPSGEIAPSVRTPEIHSGSLSVEQRFGRLNYFILFIYLALLVGMGLWFSKRQHSTEDFFRGGRRIPWWAAGLSIFGTQLSAITFMAIPAKTFATDWLYFFLMMTIIMVAPFIIRYFLPFYRRFNLTTAYEYLELRFNLTTRLIGSIMYTLLQLGRLGIVLLLPSLALAVVTGIDVKVCILTMGLLSIFYTVLGGIEAVIWTDVIQVIVLLGGALLSLLLLVVNMDGPTIHATIQEFGKTRIFDFDFSLTEPTLWVVLIGGFASNLIQYGSDQTVVQRYLTTKDEKSAARGILTGAWLALPSTLIFFSLGTLLFIYYKTNPGLLNPALENTDSIFPWYIINDLPQGVSGLLIAAIFAASMSSLDSSMNSVSTVLTTDFIRRLRPQYAENQYLITARMITVIIGGIGTVLAWVMATQGISSLWDQFNMIVGLFAGGLGGVFILGIFFRRTNGTGAVVGLILSGIVQYGVKEYTDLHLLMYAFTGMASCIFIGYITSLWYRREPPSKMQYTYFNLD